jgi:hypothetical protein
MGDEYSGPALHGLDAESSPHACVECGRLTRWGRWVDGVRYAVCPDCNEDDDK